jgi:hypothetical protein
MADKVVLRGPEQEKFMNRILDEGVKPHAETIAKIALNRDVAVVAFEVVDDPPIVKESLRSLGWHGEPVFALNRTRAEQMAVESAKRNDPVTAAWLRRRTMGRIYLCTGAGTLLVNYDEKSGYSLEPGSSDTEHLS